MKAQAAPKPVKRYRTNKPAPYLHPSGRDRAERRLERYARRLERLDIEVSVENIPSHIKQNAGFS